jgi:hypothetical protein
MNKEIAKELDVAAKKVAGLFSKTNREGNFNKETFEVDEIIPTSDHAAVVKFKKNTGKIGLAFFYYINKGASKGWKYFFPTDSHINGMRAFEYIKYEIERENFKFNFSTPENQSS